MSVKSEVREIHVPVTVLDMTNLLAIQQLPSACQRLSTSSNCSTTSEEDRRFALDFDDEEDGENRPRKRQRLTHLSPGEKLQRRKLKNRVAAQAARDRKKAHFEELEAVVFQLQEENKRLEAENAILRESKSLCQSCQNQIKNMTPIVSTIEPASVESAVLTPQQKDRIQAVLALMIASYSLLSLAAWSKSTPCCNSLKQRTCLKQPNLVQQLPFQLQAFLRKWWGPQQNAWNPSRKG